MTQLRSVLYVPASNLRALEKIPTIKADAFIIDLEDAISPQLKSNARQQLKQVLSSFYSINKTIAVRVNRVGSNDYYDDLAALDYAAVKAIVLPKIEKPEEITNTIEYLNNKELTFWAMIETPKGVLNCANIAASSAQLSTLVLGTSDLANALNLPAQQNRQGLIYSLSHSILCARSYGLNILDGVELNLNDVHYLELSCLQGKELGFDGKTLIHPKQIDCCNRVFSPTKQEIDKAKAIIKLWQQNNSGLAVFEDQLIEQLHVDRAQSLLEAVGN